MDSGQIKYEKKAQYDQCEFINTKMIADRKDSTQNFLIRVLGT